MSLLTVAGQPSWVVKASNCKLAGPCLRAHGHTLVVQGNLRDEMHNLYFSEVTAKGGVSFKRNN